MDKILNAVIDLPYTTASAIGEYALTNAGAVVIPGVIAAGLLLISSAAVYGFGLWRRHNARRRGTRIMEWLETPGVDFPGDIH